MKSKDKLSDLVLLYQDLLKIIEKLEKDYQANPTEENKKILNSYLEEKEDYLSLIRNNQDAEFNECIYELLSDVDKKTYLETLIDKLEKVNGKKVLIDTNNCKKKISKQVKTKYLKYLSMLNYLNSPKQEDICPNVDIETKQELPVIYTTATKSIGSKIQNLSVKLASFVLATTTFLTAGYKLHSYQEDENNYASYKGTDMAIQNETVIVECEEVSLASTRTINYTKINYTPSLSVIDDNIYYHDSKSYSYTYDELMQLAKLVSCEAGGINDEDKYIDSMAVMSVILNRIEDLTWNSYGSTPLEQIAVPGQFTTYEYSLMMSDDEVPKIVVQAVKDCLDGTRNHNFTSFRDRHSKTIDRVQIVAEGNNYFGIMKSIIEDDISNSNEEENKQSLYLSIN